MLRNTKTKRSSPLSTSTVINNLLDDEDNDIPLQPIRTIEEGAEMHADLISTIIEKNQLSILNTTSNQQDYIYSNMSTTAGGIRGVPPSNFANQDSVTRTIQVNSLTIHHVEQDFYGALDEGIEDEQGENQRKNFDKKRAKSWYYYDLYLKERTGRILGIIVIVSFFVVHGLRFGSDVWIGLLVRNQSSPFHLGIYGVFSGAIAFGILVSGYIFSNSVLKKSFSLHNRVFKAVLRAPIAFYDATPIGQILSNFAKHVYVMDEFLPEGWLQVLSFAPIIVGTVLLISVIMPWFGVTLPIYFFLVWFLVSRCTKSAERLKALEASNKAPMFSHLSTTLEGLFSIRLYYCEELFDTFNQGLIDADNKALHALMAVKSFQSLYLDLISTLFIYSCALYVVLFQTTNVIAGLALSNALQLLLLLQWFVRTSADVHGTMFSVSSVVYFGNQVPTEGPAIIKDHRPVKSWPSAGEIEFRNLVLKYNRYGVSVLKNVSFTIRGGEKIGVVGKSGSGKTTLLVSLLRITEPSEGSIHIDGLDISSIGLQDLRSKIAVIPQEPVLFTGTVRTNLDPFDLRSDEEVWKSLRSVHLSVKIEEMPAKLDTPVTENGKAFTMAERQLFCIARAILMHTKIVVLDEPLVAVDKETDRLIQQTIKENFTDHTVIVLASRFNLIMGADRIIVMEKGRIVEFDTPLKLLNDPRSKLIKMINNAADVDVNKLKMLAEKKEKERPYKYSVPCKRQGSGSSKLPTLFNPSLKSHYVKQHGIVPNVSSTTESDGEFDTISRSSSASSAASMPKSLENIFGEANNFANPLNKKKE